MPFGDKSLFFDGEVSFGGTKVSFEEGEATLLVRTCFFREKQLFGGEVLGRKVTFQGEVPFFGGAISFGRRNRTFE